MNQREFNRTRFPIVKATVCAIVKNGNKVLLTKRNVNPEKNKWSIPAGHIDIGVTAFNAVKREIKEETGLTLKNITFLKYYDEYVPKLRIHSLVLIFVATAKGKEKPNHETKEQKWFTWSKINKMKLAFFHKKILHDFLS